MRLTSRRGQAQTLEVRRKVDGDAEKLLAQSLVLTLIQLRPDGPRRHDVVIYEVSRGGLGSFTVDLPPGLAVETVGTDEGEMVPAIESRRLTVQRRQQLRGAGYLVLTSTPAAGAELPLDPVVPEGTVRARYVALASSIAADAHPLPAASWSRIDLDDLPPTLLDAIGGVDLAAAWRLASESSRARGWPSRALPAAPSLPAVASLRETTTLITLDGTLLHRDRITLRPAGHRHCPRPDARPRSHPLVGAGGRRGGPSAGARERQDLRAARLRHRQGHGRRGRLRAGEGDPGGALRAGARCPPRRRAGAGAPLAPAAAGRRPLPLPLRRSAAGGKSGEDPDRPGSLDGSAGHPRRHHRPDQRRRHESGQQSQYVGPGNSVERARGCAAGSPTTGAASCRGSR